MQVAKALHRPNGHRPHHLPHQLCEQPEMNAVTLPDRHLPRCYSTDREFPSMQSAQQDARCHLRSGTLVRGLRSQVEPMPLGRNQQLKRQVRPRRFPRSSAKAAGGTAKRAGLQRWLESKAVQAASLPVHGKRQWGMADFYCRQGRQAKLPNHLFPTWRSEFLSSYQVNSDPET